MLKAIRTVGRNVSQSVSRSANRSTMAGRIGGTGTTGTYRMVSSEAGETSESGNNLDGPVSSSSSSSPTSSTSPSSPSSLNILNPQMRKAILEGYPASGPLSLKSRRAKLRYNKPNGLDEAFPFAYDIIQKEQDNIKQSAAQVEKQFNSLLAGQAPEELDNEKLPSYQALKEKHNKLLADSEVINPEVQYNYKIKKLDYKHPVYRHLAETEWRSYNMLITIQRLEQLHVIPDALPTIDLRADVKLQFPGYIRKWIEPGTIVRNAVAARAPRLVIQEFQEIPDDSLYTVLIVDPDTPDVENDSFKTTLHWAVCNIPISNSKPDVNVELGDQLVAYLPPIPEKNTPTHRYCVFAFRQPQKLSNEIKLKRDEFSVSIFSKKYGLDAVGGHVYRAKYDRSSDEVREKYGLPKGRVFSRTKVT